MIVVESSIDIEVSTMLEITSPKIAIDFKIKSRYFREDQWTFAVNMGTYMYFLPSYVLYS